MYKTLDAQSRKNTHLTEHTHAHIKAHLRKLLIMIKKWWTWYDGLFKHKECQGVWAEYVKEYEFLYDMYLRHERVN